jgi:2-polyprenyl-3-methyl-5-hydroxy-6-metoxy-1,4-benzoquinol methylase
MSDDDAREATRAVWRRGSYEVVGDWIAEASRDVLNTDEGPLPLAKRDLLDVACGTGAVAIEAARRGARVVGLDLTPELLDVARSRAAVAGVDASFVEGSFDQLDGVGRFDVVASAFGVMFAADPVAVAAELTRACRSGGTVALAAWDRDGAFGTPPEAIREMLPDRGIDVNRWAEPENVAGFFAHTGCVLVAARYATIGVPFPSARAAVDAFLTHSGPWMALFYGLTAADRVTARRVLEDHLAERSDEHPGGLSLRADYAVLHLLCH